MNQIPIFSIIFAHKSQYLSKGIFASLCNSVIYGGITREEVIWTKSKRTAVFFGKPSHRCTQRVFKKKIREMTTNRLRRTIILWTFGSSVSNLIIRYFFFNFFLGLYHKLKPSSCYDSPKNVYHRNSKNLWSRTDQSL